MAALARSIASLFLSTLMVVGVMAPAASAASHESDLLALMNSARAEAGLAPVTMHSDLIDDAAAWSQQMHREGSLSHNPNLSAVTTGWEKLGENVGLGPTISSLHNAFMDSAGHRRNVLGDFDHVGIAVVAETPTKLWVTVVFMKTLGEAEAPNPTSDPDPYAKQQPEPAPHQPEPAPQEPTAPPTATPKEPSARQPEPASPIRFARPPGRLFAI